MTTKGYVLGEWMGWGLRGAGAGWRIRSHWQSLEGPHRTC